MIVSFYKSETTGEVLSNRRYPVTSEFFVRPVFTPMPVFDTEGAPPLLEYRTEVFRAVRVEVP